MTMESDRGRVPIDTLIENEITHCLQNRSWARLDMCFKWRLVSAFLQEQGLAEDMDDTTRDTIRSRIRCNALDGVEYDSQAMKITRMDVTRFVAEAAPGPADTLAPTPPSVPTPPSPTEEEPGSQGLLPPPPPPSPEERARRRRPEGLTP